MGLDDDHAAFASGRGRRPCGAELWIWRDWRYMFGSIRYVSGEERASGTGTIEESVKHGSHSAV